MNQLFATSIIFQWNLRVGGCGILAFVGLFLLLTACAHPANTSRIPKVQTLPEIHVVETPVLPGHSEIDAYDAQTLFDRAAKSLREGDCARAVSLYQQLEVEFQNSPLLEPALYNRGICFDQLGKYEDAVATYHTMLIRFPNSQDTVHVLFRLAGSQENLEAWHDMIATLDTLWQREELLSPLDEVELRARKGAALIELATPELARIELEHAIRIFTRNEDISPTSPNFHYSMAQFKLAEITHAQMRAMALPTNEETLREILEKKCQMLLDSQYLYTQVIRIGHPHWSAAAAYRTGALYHHLWEDMLNAPAPDGLTEEERGVYQEVLRKRIRILLQKAVTQWRRTVKFAQRLDLDNDWVVQTQQDLKEIETVLEIENQVGADLAIE